MNARGTDTHWLPLTRACMHGDLWAYTLESDVWGVAMNLKQQVDSAVIDQIASE